MFAIVFTALGIKVRLAVFISVSLIFLQIPWN